MTPEPLACALLLIVAFSAAGVAQVLWLRSPRSAPLAIALDGGLRWRGQRLLGEHKTLRGFVVLVPAAGAAFALLGVARDALPSWLGAGLWPMTPSELFLLGAWAAFWFMAGELPNSFLKRRWGFAPGEVPACGAKRAVCLVLDRVDSILAMLLALSLVAPLAWQSWFYVLLLGSCVHLFFSAALCLARVKKRFA